MCNICYLGLFGYTCTCSLSVDKGGVVHFIMYTGHKVLHVTSYYKYTDHKILLYTRSR